MRESAIERYLDVEVRRAGGTTRKFLGRKANPDRIVIWPALTKYGRAGIVFVECKAPGEKPRPGQVRELKRLDDMGCTALVCSSKEWVDNFVEAWRDRD